VEALILSKLTTPDRDTTARVWQPADFQGAEGSDSSFAKDPWSVKEMPSFEPFDLKKWEQAVEQELVSKKAALAQAKAQADKLSAEIQEIQNKESPVISSAATAVPSITEADLQKARTDAHANGVAEGRRLMQEELKNQQASAAARAEGLVKEMDSALRGLMQAPERWFEPLKRLSLHLAQELVKSELTLSPAAIERLIHGCIGELSATEGAVVKIELNPQDAQLLADQGIQNELWRVVPNDSLKPASVRASSEDSVVSDLIEHRLAALAEQLLPEPAPAQDSLDD
jgi:flagellar biosynthesis/type III secretory pathway protein FliH